MAGIVAAWLNPSDVANLILRQEHVLLGRYSEAHFVVLSLATLLVAAAACMHLAGIRFVGVLLRLGLVAGSIASGFAVMSHVSFLPAKPRYIETPVSDFLIGAEKGLTGTTRRRQPSQRFALRRSDRPPTARSYAAAPMGFPTRDITLTTDELGFRNPEVPAACETVVVGDSFAEGSMVLDEDVWVRRVADRLDSCVYNAAVSGADPWEYLNNLAAFGLPLKPRSVVFMVYEGNDFKRRPRPRPAGPAEATLRDQLHTIRDRSFKRSPLRAKLKRVLLGQLGPVWSDLPAPENPAFEWMPIRLDYDEQSHAYAFEPRRLRSLLWSREAFRRSPEWATNEEAFRALIDLAESRGAEVLGVYAPSAPHVILPLARDRIRPDALRAFLEAEEEDQPETEELLHRVFSQLDTQQEVFLSFCRERSIPCIGLTEPLRLALTQGEQVYFTYDQHWTALGHAVVAGVVEAALRTRADPTL